MTYKKRFSANWDLMASYSYSESSGLNPRFLIGTGADSWFGQGTAVFLTSQLIGYASTDTLPVRPPPDSLIVRYPLRNQRRRFPTERCGFDR